MANEIARIEKLIALAASPGTPEEEARTAALIAVRKIAALKLVLVGERGASSAPKPTSTGPRGPVDWKDFRVVMDDFVPWGVPKQVAPRRRIRAAFPGRCGVCGKYIEPGDTIYWTPIGSRTWCATCGEAGDAHEEL